MTSTTLPPEGVTTQPPVPDDDLADLQRRYARLREDLASQAPENRVRHEAGMYADQVAERFHEESREADMCNVYDGVLERANAFFQDNDAYCLVFPERTTPTKEISVPVDVPWTVSGTHRVWVTVEVPDNGDLNSEDYEDSAFDAASRVLDSGEVDPDDGDFEWDESEAQIDHYDIEEA